MPPSNPHLAPGARFHARPPGVDNLTAGWRRHWQAAPDTKQIHCPVRGWLTRGEIASDRLVDPERFKPGEQHVPFVTECSVDDKLLVRCTIKWAKLQDALTFADAEDYPGSVDYTLIAYVNQSSRGEQ